jgi:hypothetical protein
MSRQDLEPWERVFHDRHTRQQEIRMASVPDYGDEDLYRPSKGDVDG